MPSSSVLGRRVLDTGASGGVGHFACQLGLAGAHVLALVRNPRSAELTRRTEPRPGSMAPMTSLSTASAAPCSASMLVKDGICVTYGVSAGSVVTFDARTFFRSDRHVLYGFYLFEEFYHPPLGTASRDLPP